MDLYVGDPTLFVCDKLASAVAALHSASERCLRHVALHDVPVTVVEDIKGFLNQRQSRFPERITVILHSLEDYGRFQTALFSTFPEEV